MSEDCRGRPGGGELISAVCALALAATMFALRWFGTITPPPTGAVRSATTGSENAWVGLPVVRWVMVAAIAAALAAALWRTATRGHATTSRLASVAVVALGTGAAALLVYRVLIALPSQGEVVDQKLGAYLGLLAAVGIAYGAVDSLAARRAPAGSAKRP